MVLEILLAPVIAALVIGTIVRVVRGNGALPNSFGDTLPYLIVGALAGALGLLAPAPRAESVDAIIRAIPLIVFTVLSVAAYIARDSNN